MPRTVAMLTLLLATGLGSCVTQPAAPGFAWSYQDNVGEGPKLAYGEPASDNVVLMMVCDPVAQRIDVSLMGGSPQGGLVLASGGARQLLPADVAASPGSGQVIQASTHPTAAPLARFARTGDLSLIDRGRAVSLDATPLDRASVTRFFAACRA